jgi:hypothetical protein
MASFTVEQDVRGAAASFEPLTTSQEVDAGLVSSLGSAVFGFAESIGDAAIPTAAETKAKGVSSLEKTLRQTMTANEGSDISTRRTQGQKVIANARNSGVTVSEQMLKQYSALYGVDFGESLEIDVANQQIEAFSQDSLSLGYVQLARNNAKTKGVAISEQEAIQQGFELWSQNQALGQAALAMNQIQWNTQTRDTAIAYMDSLTNAAVSAIFIEQEGGNVNPESIARLEAGVEVFKQAFAQKEGVSDTQYKPIQDKIERALKSIEYARNYDEKLLTAEGRAALVAILKDIDEPAMMALLKGGDFEKEVMSQLQGDYVEKIAQSIRNSKELGIEYTELVFDENIRTLLQMSDEDALDFDGLQNVDLHPSEAVSKVQEIANIESATDRAKAQQDFLSEAALHNFTLQSLDTPEGQKAWALGIGKTTLMLSEMKDWVGFGEKGKVNALKSLTSTSTLEKLTKIKNLNPSLGASLHAQIAKALENQNSIYMQRATVTFNQSPFSVNIETGQLGLKQGSEGVLASVSAEALRNIEAIAMQYYDGNLNALLSSSKEEIKKRIESRAETDEIAERGLRILDERQKGEASITGSPPWFTYGFGIEFGILRKSYGEVKNLVPTMQRLTTARRKLNIPVEPLQFGMNEGFPNEQQAALEKIESGTIETDAFSTWKNSQERESARLNAAREARLQKEVNQTEIKTLLITPDNKGTFENPYVLYGHESKWEQILKTQVPPNSFFIDPDSGTKFYWEGQ